jgi:hypothetical protein
MGTIATMMAASQASKGTAMALATGTVISSAAMFASGAAVGSLVDTL